MSWSSVHHLTALRDGGAIPRPAGRALRPGRVQFIFVYVREAHPGEHYPHHASFEQKLRHAQAFRELFGMRRPILVDDLQGTAVWLAAEHVLHRGSGRQGGLRSDWTQPEVLAWAVANLVDGLEARRAGRRAVPYYLELLPMRISAPDRFEERLRRAGPKAVEEFRRTLRACQQSGHNPVARE